MIYDPNRSRLILFGGWANRWFNDLHVCKVGEVVGPPYAIDSIEPTLGPITGGTACMIHGVGFRSSGSQATVRFASARGYIESPAEVTDDSTISFDAPNYEKYGAVTVEGRVSVGGKAYSSNAVHFNYFAVTSADTSLYFGPGALDGCLAKHPVIIILQAKDSMGSNRTCIRTLNFALLFIVVILHRWDG